MPTRPNSRALLIATSLLATTAGHALAQQAHGGVAASDAARIDRLEQRMDETDAKLDQIMGLLQQLANSGGAASAPATSAAATPAGGRQPAAPITEPQSVLLPGYTVRVAGQNPDQWRAFSEATIGEAVVRDDSVGFGRVTDYIGFHPGTFVGLEMHGILSTRVAGTHTVMVRLTSTSAADRWAECSLVSSIGGVELMNEAFGIELIRGNRVSRTGAVKLEPGQYDVSVWATCQNGGDWTAQEGLVLEGLLVLPEARGAQPFSQVLSVSEAAS